MTAREPAADQQMGRPAVWQATGRRAGQQTGRRADGQAGRRAGGQAAGGRRQAAGGRRQAAGGACTGMERAGKKKAPGRLPLRVRPAGPGSHAPCLTRSVPKRRMSGNRSCAPRDRRCHPRRGPAGQGRSARGSGVCRVFADRRALRHQNQTCSHACPVRAGMRTWRGLRRAGHSTGRRLADSHLASPTSMHAVGPPPFPR